MKRILSMIISLALTLSALAGCAGLQKASGRDSEKKPETENTVNAMVEKVYLLASEGNQYTKTEITFDALSDISDGTYYVVMEVLLGGNCDPDAPQHSYRYEDVFCLVVGDVSATTGHTGSLDFLRYRWDGGGLSAKTVEDCDVVYRIIDALKNLKVTGKTAARISDDVIDTGGPEYPVDYGTMWIKR